MDLETGKRKDLFFSPKIQVLEMYGLDLQNIVIDPEGKRLFVVGVGLNPETYQEVVKWKWRMPRPSILCFDIGSLDFSKKNTLWTKMKMDSESKFIHSYAGSGQIDALKEALKIGVNVDEILSGSTPLIDATRQCQVEAVKILLKNGADPNLTDVLGRSALDITQNDRLHKLMGKVTAKDAEIYGHIRKLLIAAGADNTKKKEPSMSFEQEKEFFFAIAANGNIKKIKDLLDREMDVNHTVYFMTALLSAASNCQLDMVKFLLNNGADPNAKNINGQTAYDVAGDELTHKILGRTSEKDKATYREIQEVIKRAMERL